MTGTVLAGSVSVNDEMEFPSLHITRKVRSIPMLNKGMDKALKGDGSGICVQWSLIIKLTGRSFGLTGERGEACALGSLTAMRNVLVRLKKIRFDNVELVVCCDSERCEKWIDVLCEDRSSHGVCDDDAVQGYGEGRCVALSVLNGRDIEGTWEW